MFIGFADIQKASKKSRRFLCFCNFQKEDGIEYFHLYNSAKGIF